MLIFIKMAKCGLFHTSSLKNSAKEKVYYICVNDAIKSSLSSKYNFIDLEPYFEFDTIYQGMGIDRVAACCTITDGMIVDAGSAITVDIMSGGCTWEVLFSLVLVRMRSVMLPFSRLNLPINPSIALDALPQKPMMPSRMVWLNPLLCF